MPLVIKSKSLGYLEKLGLQSLVGPLQAGGVKVGLGVNDLSFYSPSGEKLATVELPVSCADLAAGKIGVATKAGAVKKIIATANQVIGSPQAHFVSAPVLVPVASVNLGAENVPPVPKTKIPASVIVKPDAAITGAVESVIALREATQLYERVRGSSAGSVYVVVAVSESLKLAARLAGESLSVRCESSSGAFTAAQQAKLVGQGLSNKGGYASGHFSVGQISPLRVLGAILLGLDTPFNTPLPNFDKVKELGK